jgi:hypothetical protein
MTYLGVQVTRMRGIPRSNAISPGERDRRYPEFGDFNDGSG